MYDNIIEREVGSYVVDCPISVRTLKFDLIAENKKEFTIYKKQKVLIISRCKKINITSR